MMNSHNVRVKRGATDGGTPSTFWPEHLIGEGTPAPDRLGDGTGRHFEEGVALQAPSLGTTPGSNKEQGGGAMTDPHRWRGDGD